MRAGLIAGFVVVCVAACGGRETAETADAHDEAPATGTCIVARKPCTKDPKQCCSGVCVFSPSGDTGE